MVSRVSVTVVLAVPLCAAAVSVGTSLASSGSVVYSDSHAVNARYPVNGLLKKNFTIFRLARRSTHGQAQVADSSTPPLPHPIDASATVTYELNPADTQYVQEGAASVWVVPGATGACMLARTVLPVLTSTANSAAGVRPRSPWFEYCETAANIDSDGLVDSLGWSMTTPQGDTSKGEVIASLVPDGNATIAVTSAAGDTALVPVENNIAVHTYPQGDVTMKFKNYRGEFVSIVQRFPSASGLGAMSSARHATEASARSGKHAG